MKIIPISQTHWAVLSGTRFLLSCIVVNAHSGLVVNADNITEYNLYIIGRQLGPLAAILGFLVISGFSIAHSFSVQPNRFYSRRIARIWPVLVITTLLFIVVTTNDAPIQTPDGSIFYSPKIISIITTLLLMNAVFAGSFFGPTWSLGVEVIFYGFTPLLARVSSRILIYFSIISCIIYYMHEFVSPLASLGGAKFGLGALGLFWAFTNGFILARTDGDREAKLAVALVSGIVLLGRWNWEGGQLSWFTYLCAVLVVGFGGKMEASKKVIVVLNYIGDLSFPLYLVHFPVIIILYRIAENRHTSILWGASLIAAVVLLHGVDRPCRRWINQTAQHLSACFSLNASAVRP